MHRQVIILLIIFLFFGTAPLAEAEDGRWSEMNDGLGDREVLAIDWEPDRTYAGTPSGLYIFWNRGVDWSEGSMGLPVPSIMLNVEDELIYIARAGGSWSDGIWLSEDEGRSWNVLTWIVWPSIMTSEIGNPDHMIVAAEDGIHISEDAGQNWFSWNQGLEGTVDHIQWGNIDGSIIVTSTDQGLYFCLPDEDYSQWEAFGIDGAGYHHQIAFDAEVENRIWVAFHTRGDQCGAYFIDGLDGEWERAFHIPDCVVIKSIPGLIAAGNHSGVYVSTDGGEEWVLLDEGWEGNRQVTDLHVRQIGDLFGILVSTVGDGVLTYRFDPTAGNEPPEPFNLLVPENDGWVRAEYDTTLIWQASHDPDPDDEVSYLLHLASLSDDLSYTFETADTTFDVVMAELFNCGGCMSDNIEWWVEACSGEDTVGCEERFTFEAIGSGKVTDADLANPADFRITAAYPNPFNASVMVGFSMPWRNEAHLAVYDVTGCEIVILCDETLDAGRHEFQWNAEGQSAGLYFARVKCGETTQDVKLVLVR